MSRPPETIPVDVDVPLLHWHGCYDDGWKGFIIDEAFRHPAKFSRGLIRRIVLHGLKVGWWRLGDLIGDPFGGVALGGLVCAYNGLRWFGVELESKATGGSPFVELGNANIELHRCRLLAGGMPIPVLLQGDSRQFASIVRAAGIVTSPPYAGISPEPFSKTIDCRKNWETYRASGGGMSFEAYRAHKLTRTEAYGKTDGQISVLPEGDLPAVLTSPPYQDGLGHGDGRADHPMYAEKGLASQAVTQYGKTEGQIGRLPPGDVAGVVTSPSFVDARQDTTRASVGSTAPTKQDPEYFGETPGQIDNLPEGQLDGAITSPPWEANCEGGVKGDAWADPDAAAAVMAERDAANPRTHTPSPQARRRQFARQAEQSYDTSDGQIGREAGETYWQAMSKVYEQCRLALRPGGIMCVVVKDYVKNKQRVPLCGQTLQLLIHLGFEPVVRIRAHLVKETRTTGIFGQEEVRRTERKSFFRRLAEKKGSPRIDWEEVLVVRKPDCAEASP